MISVRSAVKFFGKSMRLETLKRATQSSGCEISPFQIIQIVYN
jgi:hypothetical protein